jgi:hypothetical protein
VEVAQRTVRLLPMQRAGGQLLGVIRTTVVWSRASPPCPRGGSERSTWPAESCDQGGWKRGCTVLDGHGIDCYVATASRTRSARVGGTDPSRTCDWAVCAVSWWWRWMQWRCVSCALPQGDTTYRGTPSRRSRKLDVREADARSRFRLTYGHSHIISSGSHRARHRRALQVRHAPPHSAPAGLCMRALRRTTGLGVWSSEPFHHIPSP